MVAVTIKTDIANAIRLLDDKFKRQLPFATSVALNETARKVQGQMQVVARAVFDRPTPFFLRSFYVKYSNKRDLRAFVFLNDRLLGGKNPNSLAEILDHQFAGGNRIHKRLEGALNRAGLIGPDEYVAPAAGARLDQYGNMSRGQTQQLLSQLYAHPDPQSNKTDSSRSRLNVKRAGRIFWSRGGRLARGAWIDSAKGLLPLLLVVAKPTYKKRIDMEAVADQVVKRDFDQIFKTAFEAAARTAR